MLPGLRKLEPAVPQRVKNAFEYLYVTPGALLQGLAKHVGLPTFKLRYAMSQPHCLRWMLEEKQARLEAVSVGNIGALVGVRDFGDTAMAKVHAAKTLEQMLGANPWCRSGLHRVPCLHQR
jgi:hypothetical protein